MGLKIHDVRSDSLGNLEAVGSLDGDPFHFASDGDRWVMSVNSTPVVERQALDHEDRSSINSVIWEMLARFREASKPKLNAFA